MRPIEISRSRTGGGSVGGFGVSSGRAEVAPSRGGFVKKWFSSFQRVFCMGNFNQAEGKFGVANWFLEVALEVALECHR